MCSWACDVTAASPLTSTPVQFGTRVTSQLEKSNVSLDWAAEDVPAWSRQGWGALLRAGTQLNLLCCLNAELVDAHAAGKQKQGGVVFAASPKPSPWMWFPSPEGVILCCWRSMRDTTVPQLPVVLITYSLAKVDLLYEYFRIVETACEPKSNSLWFSHQNSKYPNLNVGVKANLVKGFRCWEPLCDEKLSQRPSL